MPATISPNSMEGNSKIQHQAYQRFILAQMGITPWVSQEMAGTYFDSEAILSQSSSISIPIKQSFEATLHANSDMPTAMIHPTSNVADAVLYTVKNTVKASDILTNNRTISVAQATLPALTCRYQIQVMLLTHWIFVADEHVLQQDSRQLELWQNIAKSMQATLLSLQFPLVNQDNQSQNQQLISQVNTNPEMMQQLFANKVAGMASFKGLIHAHLRAGMQVGYVTPLPEPLLDYPMQALPTLMQMLGNPSLKRELWQMIKNPNP